MKFKILIGLLITMFFVSCEKDYTKDYYIYNNTKNSLQLKLVTKEVVLSFELTPLTGKNKVFYNTLNGNRFLPTAKDTLFITLNDITYIDTRDLPFSLLNIDKYKLSSNIDLGDYTSYVYENSITDEYIKTLKVKDPPKEINFNPNVSYGEVADIDGNVYKTVKIGNQTWMAENLRVTHYNDGSSISYISEKEDWAKASPYGLAFAYCDIGNNEIYRKIYGLLYTFGTVSDRYANSRGNKSIAPKGWHIPSFNDWEKLTNYLGGYVEAYNKMKESGDSHWLNNQNSTNESGFTAIPAGIRNFDGEFYNNVDQANWWTSTEYIMMHYPGFRFNLSSDYPQVYLGYSDMNIGYSVRCVMD